MTDVHTHLAAPPLFCRAREILCRAVTAGVDRIVVCGTGPDDWPDVARLTDGEERFLPAYGLHPRYVASAPAGWENQLRYYLDRDPRAHIGEIGLDRAAKKHDLAGQRAALDCQLDLAEETRRPVTLHVVRAWGAIFSHIEHRSLRYLFHAFYAAREILDRLLRFDSYISLSAMTLRRMKSGRYRSLPLSLPADRLLLESDLDDPARTDGEGPASLPALLRDVAALREDDIERLTSTVDNNANRFLGGGHER